MRGRRAQRTRPWEREYITNYNAIVLKKCVASTAGQSTDDQEKVSNVRVVRTAGGQAIGSPLRGNALIDPKQKFAVVL